MSEVPITERVREFYEQFPFPGIRHPDQDGLVLMRRLAAARGRPLRILDAGCGTGNTTVSFAATLPGAELLGVDICSASLEHARQLAASKGLENVRFETADLIDLPTPDRLFDVILCLGVLHHTEDMSRSLESLRRALAPDGDLYLWLYGAHGRFRHTLNRRLLALLLEADSPLEDRIGLAREFALGTGDGEPLRDLYGEAPGMADSRAVVLNDAWIADQFLHVHEAPVDLPEILDQLDGAGLRLKEWIGVDDAAHGRIAPARLAERLAELPERTRLHALDLLLKPSRYFVVAAHRTQA